MSASSSLLETARSDVRFNLQYLKSNANTNLRKNIQTMKRLFNGEEGWKDHESVGTTITGSASSTSSSLPATRQNIEAADNKLDLHNIDWERLPSEILSNVKRNTTILSEWIHDVSGGKVPAFSRTPPSDTSNTGTSTTGGDGGSIATRIRNFHILKQRDDTTLVMDRYWIAKNIFFALLPGLLLHLYFLSLQEEMAEYYGKIEQMERERILGIEGKGSNSGGTASSPLKNECIRDRETMMGISSALIPEGGTIWDKLKLAVNDLFLGGVEKRLGKDQAAVEVEEKEESEKKVEGAFRGATVHASTGHSSVSTSPVNQPPQEVIPSAIALVKDNNNGDDVTVHMLLERIRALEAHIANSAGGEDEERQRRQREEEHQIKRQVERVKQSPIKNRRDNVLEAKWKNEAKNDDSSSNGEEEDVESGNRFDMLVGVANSAWLTTAPYFESVLGTVSGKLREIASLGLDMPSESEASNLLSCTTDDDILSAAHTGEEVKVSAVAGSIGESVSDIIDTSIDGHQDENEHFDRASNGHWAMNIWKRIQKSSSSHPVSVVEENANGK